MPHTWYRRFVQLSCSSYRGGKEKFTRKHSWKKGNVSNEGMQAKYGVTTLFGGRRQMQPADDQKKIPRTKNQIMKLLHFVQCGTKLQS
jgi:hypothetical protein